MVAETRTEAEDKKAAYDRLPNDIDQLSLLSEALNFDFATKGAGRSRSLTKRSPGINGMQSMRDRVVQAGYKNPTVRDFMRVTGRGLLHEAWVGSSEQTLPIRIEEWWSSPEPACDGFVVGPDAPTGLL